MPIAAADATSIEQHIAAVEARTGVQIVTMIAGKSDAYPELAWMAFAVGAALSALVVVMLDFLRPQWASGTAAMIQSLVILCVGALCAAVTIYSRSVGRVLLSKLRAAGEVRQAAEAAFLTRELFATPDRTAVLLYVSLFERHVEIVPDAGYRARIDRRGWDAVIAAMTTELRSGRVVPAFHAGLDALERELLAKGFAPRPAGGNTFPERIAESSA